MKIIHYLLISILLSSLISCSEDSANGSNSLITTENEPLGPNCLGGGLKINSGLDLNNNGTLEESEVTSTNYICDGIDGQTSNRETRFLLFESSGFGISGNSTFSTQLVDFNKEYYNADSAALVAILDPSAEGEFISIRLIDLTNDIAVQDALIEYTSTTSDTTYVKTNKNFFQNLPNGSVDLGLNLDVPMNDYYSGGLIILVLFKRE